MRRELKVVVIDRLLDLELNYDLESHEERIERLKPLFGLHSLEPTESHEERIES